MAGKPSAAPRAAQPSSTKEHSGDSRPAAAADWGAPAARAGVRLEVKLAVLLIVTLSGAFGYLVHRKFDALRQQAAAAEGNDPEKFVPLPRASQVAEEIDLGAPPTQPARNEPPFGSSATSAVAQTSATMPAAASSPPLLNWVPATPRSEPASLTGPDRQKLPMGGEPPRELPLQSEPASLGDSTDTGLLGLFGGREGETPGGVIVPEQTPGTDPTPTTAGGSRVVFPSEDPRPLSEEPLAFPDHVPSITASPVPAATASPGPVTPSTVPLLAGEGSATPPATPGEAESVAAGTPPREPAGSAAESPPLPPPQREEPFEPRFEPAPFEPAERPSVPPTEAAPAFPTPAAPPVQGGESSPFSAESAPPRMSTDPQPHPVEGTTPDGDPFRLFSPATPPAATSGVPAETVAAPPQESSSQSPSRFSPEPVVDPFPEVTPRGSPVPAPSLLEQPQLTAEPHPLDSATAPPRDRLLEEIATTPRPVAAPDPFPQGPPHTVPRGTFDPPPFTESSARREGTTSLGAANSDGGVRTPAGGNIPWDDRPTLERFYTVRPGDSYWTIARIQYGSGRYHAALLEYNRARLPEPERLLPGTQLHIPPVELLESQYPALVQGTAVPPLTTAAGAPPTGEESGRFFISPDGQPMYRVGKGDTLTSIAQRHLGRASRWEQIAQMNQDILPSPDRLQPGDVLRLPPDASQVAPSPDTTPARGR